MKTTTSNPNSVLKLYCNVFGHQYDVSKKVTKHVKEYTCKCCKKQPLSRFIILNITCFKNNYSLRSYPSKKLTKIN